MDNSSIDILFIKNEATVFQFFIDELKKNRIDYLTANSANMALSFVKTYKGKIKLIFCDFETLKSDLDILNLDVLVKQFKISLVFVLPADPEPEKLRTTEQLEPLSYIKTYNEKSLLSAEIRTTLRLASTIRQFEDNISELTKTKINLQTSEQQFKEVWNKSIDGMRLVDQNGKILLVNEAFCRLVEKNKSELEGNDFSIIYNSSISEISDLKIRSDRLQKFRKKVLEKEIEPTFERELFLWNGKKVWFELSNSIIDIQDENPVVLSIFRDISERKNYEKKLSNMANEQKELNDSKDKFISILSHDLRGPFNGFLGITEVLCTGLDSLTPDEIKESASLLHKALRNQYLLLEDLLTWSRIQTKRIDFFVEQFIAVEEINSVVLLLTPNADKKGITIINNIAADLEIFCDRAMLKLLFRNLIANAIKFSHSGSKIVLDANTTEEAATFSVADSGIGIDEEDILRLFRSDVHFTSSGTDNEPGTGLGLVLCKEIIDMHNGKIWVDSKPGVGSTFYFCFRNFNSALE